jgi:hypothetical protein
VGQLEGLWCKERGTLPWVVQDEENERMLGIIVHSIRLFMSKVKEF